MRRLPLWLATGAAAAAAITTTTSAAASDTPTPPSAPSVESIVNATQPGPVPPGHAQPMWRIKPTANPGSNTGVSPNTIGQPGGYDPDELRAYLGLHGTGKGQTVTIVAAWDVSEAVTDALAGYNNWYGLKPACSATITTGCFPLTIVAPAGTRTPTFDNNGEEIIRKLSWEVEAELDVEVVHAIAPDAAITVVEGFDDEVDSLFAAVDYATSLHPAVINNSWGLAEFDGEQAYDQHCQTPGALCVFASGDTGNPGLYPAASPDVLAVGGTTLDMDPAGQIRSETAWAGSGGGISPFEPQPVYQAGADPYHTGRGVPDVSFDADPNSGIAVYNVVELAEIPGFHTEYWSEVGGTSAGAPAWSAILAVAGEQRAAKGRPPLTTAQVHTAVYRKNAKGLADITLGANGICGPICSAGSGYDLVTGQGSPRPGLDTYLARL